MKTWLTAYSPGRAARITSCRRPATGVPADRLAALIGLALSYLWTERDAEEIETAAEAIELARELGDEAGLAAEGTHRVSNVLPESFH